MAAHQVTRLVEHALPRLERAGVRYFDRVGANDALLLDEARQALDAALADTMDLLISQGLAAMPLHPPPAPSRVGDGVGDVELEFERRQRLQEGANLIMTVLRKGRGASQSAEHAHSGRRDGPLAGKATERSYWYQHSASEHDELEAEGQQVQRLAAGCKMGEGDGTASLLSLGAMCVEGWKRKQYNPAGSWDGERVAGSSGRLALPLPPSPWTRISTGASRLRGCPTP